MRRKNFYKKIIITVLFSILFSWIATMPSTLVFASPPAPAPKCYVSGVIQNVRFEGEHEAPCAKTNSCPTDTQLSYPDTYYLSIKIQNVSLEGGDTRFTNCNSLYQVGSIQDIFVIQDKIKPGDVFSKGQMISGNVISFWGNSFETYSINPQLPETPPIGGPLQSIVEKMKLFFSSIVDTLRNFSRGVKSVETTVRRN